jgi:phage tail protein X
MSTTPDRHPRARALAHAFARSVGLLAMSAVLVGAAVQGVAQADSDGTTAPPGRYGAALDAVDYPIPPDAFFVSPEGDNAGDGSAASPWRTVGKAVNAAPAGSTIVLREGTYHQYATWYGKKLTLQPYPGERAVFDGSEPVTGWVTDSDSLWHVNGWTAKFKQGGRSDLIGKKNAYAAHPDMVFVDGTPLRQVGSRSSVVEGTFYTDYANNRLYVGSDPSGRSVTASTLSRALYVNNADGSVVRGLTFQRYATHPDLVAAVLATGDGLVFENNVFEHNAAIGLSDMADNSKVINNTFAYNGQMGLHSHGSDNLLIQGNWMHHNNTELFYLGGAEGGLKVTTGSNQVWADNVSEDNFGDGLWCDVHSVNITIVRNIVRNNDHRGIKCEISAHVIVASNLIMDNKTYGILNNESNHFQVWNNTLIGNGRAIQATDWTRQTADPLFTESVGNMVVKNNLMVDGRRAHLAIEDFTRQRSAEQMGVTADYNGYFRTVGTPQYASMWARNGGTIRFLELTGFRRRTGQEAHGVAVNDTPSPFTNPTMGDYTVRPDTPAALAGSALPTEIADALDEPAGGGPVDLGILGPLPSS